ncbi:MAG TPA: hypothetical protein VFM18_22545, partial [Methanosarcina sp.]|nr:hypothetical protein [Methanosarcina sp.]
MNTMSSYFSGTDDADDRKGCWYSGVIGNLHKEVPTASWRFTNFGIFKSLNLEDIFEVEGEINSKTEFPMEWLKRVEGRFTRPTPVASQGTLPFAGNQNWWNSRRPGQQTNYRTSDRAVFDDEYMDAHDLYLMQQYGARFMEEDFSDFEDMFTRRPTKAPVSTAVEEYKPFLPSMISSPALRQELDDLLLHLKTALNWNGEYGVALYRPIVTTIRNIILRNMNPSHPQSTGIFMLCRDLIGSLEEEGAEDIFDNAIPDNLSKSLSSVLAQASDWDGLDAMINSALQEIYYKFVEGAELSLLIDKIGEAFDDYVNKDVDTVKKGCDELAILLENLESHKTHYGLYTCVEVLRHISKTEYVPGSLSPR